MARYFHPKTDDKVALIAVAGIMASVAVWVAYAVVDSLASEGQDLGIAIFAPDPEIVRARLLAIVGILIATLFIQIIYVKRATAEAALDIERAHVRGMYENSPDRVVRMGTGKEVLFTNVSDDRSRARGDGRGDPCYAQLYSRDEACDGCPFDEVLASASVIEFTQLEDGPGDTALWFNKMLYPIRTEDGTTESIVEVARDVTALHAAALALRESHGLLEVKIAERTQQLTQTNERLIKENAVRERVAAELRESESRFLQLIDASPDMVVLHSEGRIDHVNRAGMEMMDVVDPDQLLGNVISTLWDSDATDADAQNSMAGVSGKGARNRKLHRIDGSRIDVEMSETLVLLEGRIHTQCVIRDVTQTVQARHIITRLAYYDAVSGLPNKTLYRDRLQTSLARARRNQVYLAVGLIDIDDFRSVNDTWGHAVADGLLASFAEHLQSLFRECDTVARYGSDEFALLAELKTEEGGVQLANRIRPRLSITFRTGGQSVIVTASLGIAITTGRGVTADQVIEGAHEALRMAKMTGPSGCEVRTVAPTEQKGRLRA